MKNIHLATIKVLTLVICFSLLSCQKEKDARIEYYKSQYRDPLLFGDWKSINPAVKDIERYNSDGILNLLNEEITPNGVVYVKDEICIIYYYTKNNKLYTLIADKGFKYGISEGSVKYEIRNDTMSMNGHDVSIKIKQNEINENDF